MVLMMEDRRCSAASVMSTQQDRDVANFLAMSRQLSVNQASPPPEPCNLCADLSLVESDCA
jgi:hypothetical protein